MKARNRAALASISFILAVIYSLPNLALYFAVATVIVNKWISGIACLVFAWNIAKIVESAYKEYINDKPATGNHIKQLDHREQKEWVHGEGYSYYIKDDEITFQFRNIKDDGRQVSRLIFMREKFFKDK